MSVQELLGLPAEQRADLAVALLDSLDPPADTDAEQAWDEEIRRRVDEVNAGTVTPVPWTAARAAILSDPDVDAG